jgi:hypothetical protein
MKKIYAGIILLTFVAYGIYKNSHTVSTTKPKSFGDNTNFSLSLRTFNHAEWLSKGVMIYKLKDDSFIISRHTIFQETDSVLFSKIIERNLVEKVLVMKLDTLKSFYFNECVMATSGAEFDISIKRDTMSKNIQLHHYYHKQIEQLIIELNKAIPNEYKIDYMDLDTEQDCD